MYKELRTENEQNGRGAMHMNTEASTSTVCNWRGLHGMQSEGGDAAPMIMATVMATFFAGKSKDILKSNDVEGRVEAGWGP